MGLSRADFEKYEAALAESHRMRLVVRLLGHNEGVRRVITTPSSMVLGGQVEVQSENRDEVARRLDLRIVDPSHQMRVDNASPAELAISPRNFVSVRRGIFVEDLGRWVDVPVFWGAITGFERQGDEVTIEGMSKEVLALDPYLTWNRRKFGKKTRRVHVIRELMKDQGETMFSLKPSKERIGKRLQVLRGDPPWKIASKQARAMGRQLFYNARGRLVLRDVPKQPVYTFRYGVNVTSPPRIRWQMDELRNAVWVVGEKVTPKRPRPQAVAMPGQANPLSPGSLSRNAKPRYLVHVEESTDIRRRSQAQRRADELLEEMFRNHFEVEFDALVAPHLEELDVVRLATPDVTVSFRLKDFSIPLTAEEDMTVGTVKPFWGLRKRGRKRRRSSYRPGRGYRNEI